MKLLLLYNAHRHGGGSDTVARRTVELLERDGHSVSVFTRSSQELSNLRGHLRAFFCGIWSPGVIRDFKRVLEEFRPDVVHAHEVYPLITPWIFRACKKYGIPAVMTCHDYRLSCPVATHFRQKNLCFACAGGHEIRCIQHNCCGSRVKSLAYAVRNFTARVFRLFSSVDLFLTPSGKSKEILCQYAGLSPDQVMVVGNPVSEVGGQNLEVKGSQSAIRNPQSKIAYVAYAGRFEPEKGFDLLIESLAGTGIPLKVAGDADAYSGRSIPENVEILGHLTREEMSHFYQHARLLVVPSLWHETFGLVVAEALMCGTPVIISDLGALAEVAGSGGLVVPAGDAAALRAAVLRLWNDAALCRNRAFAGREHVKRYSDEVYLSHLLEAYGKVLKGTAVDSRSLGI